MACVYEHIRTDTNTIFYIGIGKKNSRAYSKYGRNKHWKNIVKKCNNLFTVNILHDDLSWEKACQKEKQYIKKYGRIDNNTGILCNMTDGGEGILNLQHTDKAKLKISIAAKKRYKLKPQCRKGQRFVNKNSRKLVIVDLKTYIIYNYNTLVEASLFLSTSPSRVRRACIVGKSINNCYLKFGEEISKEEIKELKNKKVYALSDLSILNVNKDYSCIQKKVINCETKKVYSSISEVCRNHNLKYSTLSRQLNGVSKNKTIFKLI